MSRLLVVVDMQNDFIDGALGTNEAKNIVDAVVEKIRTWDGKVVATVDTHSDEDYINTLEGQKLPVKHCIAGTRGWNIHDAVRQELSQKHIDEKDLGIVGKNTFGSFDLLDIINKEEFDEIEICGLCTDICVMANAVLLRTKFPNTKIVVDAKTTAGATPETKDAALTTMKMLQIDVIEGVQYGLA